MISYQSTRGCRRDLKSYKVCRINKKHCQKDTGKCNGDTERIRDEIAEREVQLQQLVLKSQMIYSAEAEWDEESQNLASRT